MFAAIGTDGTREVVWGLGETVEDAMCDAEQEMHAGDCFSSGALADLHVEEVSAEQVSVIESGDVSWPVAVQGAGEEDAGMATAKQIATIRARRVDDTARAMARHGVSLTWRQAEAIGDEGCDWIARRLGLAKTTDESGVHFRNGDADATFAAEIEETNRGTDAALRAEDARHAEEWRAGASERTDADVAANKVQS